MRIQVGTNLNSLVERHRIQIATEQQDASAIRKGAEHIPLLPVASITEVAARTIEPDGTEP